MADENEDEDLEIDEEYIFQVLAEEGVTHVTMEYEGGGDSGGVERVSVDYADGRHEDFNPLRWARHWTDPRCGNATLEDPSLKPLSRVLSVMEGPVYDRYGGFNNDPYVSGTLTYDVTARQVRLDGTERYSEYSDDDDDDEDNYRHEAIEEVLYRSESPGEG